MKISRPTCKAKTTPVWKECQVSEGLPLFYSYIFLLNRFHLNEAPSPLYTVFLRTILKVSFVDDEHVLCDVRWQREVEKE